MKSTTLPATTTEYTQAFNNDTTHVWNFRDSSSAATLAEFYTRENIASPQCRADQPIINKSFPRHHLLIKASLDATTPTTTLTTRARVHACALVHETTRHASTIFTDLSTYQKHQLTSLSALARLLVSRWTGFSAARYYTLKSAKKHADLTSTYIHSELACEVLVSNQYYRDLPRLITDARSVGSDRLSAMAFFTDEDITPKSVAKTKTVLMETYAAQIDRLLHAVRQYKRGFVSLASIRTDPEFTRLMHAYWRYCNQLMKIQNNLEQNSGHDNNDDIKTRRLFVVSDVCAVAAMVPQLYNYDIAHLFDNANRSYARFVKTAKHTLVRLSNDGLTTAFLSFAAIEPRMVTAEIAPKHGTKYLTTTMNSCANHIPSRDTVFGELRVKHRAHILRTADAVNADFGIPRSPTQIVRVEYSPVHDTLEHIRAGRSQKTVPVIVSAGRAYASRQVAAAATAEAAEIADGWVLCTRNRKRK